MAVGDALDALGAVGSGERAADRRGARGRENAIQLDHVVRSDSEGASGEMERQHRGRLVGVDGMLIEQDARDPRDAIRQSEHVVAGTQ